MRGPDADDAPSTCSTSSSRAPAASSCAGRLRLARAARARGRARPTPELAGDGATTVDAAYEAEWAERPLDAATTTSTRCSAPRSRRAGRPRSTAASRSSARTATSGGCALDGLDSRTHASQGEQRTLALALRLGGPPARAPRSSAPRRCCCSTTCSASSTSSAPSRSSRISTAGQTLVTTAGARARGRARRSQFRVDAGRVEDGAVRRRSPARDAMTRRAPIERSTSRCRSATRSQRSAPSSGCRRADALAHARQRVGGGRRRRRRRARAARRGARRRARDRGRQPAVGDPAALPRRPTSSSARTASSGRGVGAARSGSRVEPRRRDRPRNQPRKPPNSGGRVWYTGATPKSAPLTCGFTDSPLVRSECPDRTDLPDRSSPERYCARGVQRQGHHRSQGPRARPRTPRDVHRIHRSHRPAPPRLRGRRQLGRRGDGRRGDADRRRRCSPTAAVA